MSLSDCIETGKDGTMLSLMDVLCDEEDLFEEISTREMSGKLLTAMDRCLTDRERRVLTLRFGLAGGPALPQREVAEKCGISRSYISRIEKKALEKLRRELGEPYGSTEIETALGKIPLRKEGKGCRIGENHKMEDGAP